MESSSPLNNRIILTGFMGCGKSYFSKKLSEHIVFNSYDTDSMIEAKSDKRVKEIFATEGEEAFRALEKDIVQDIITLDNVIIATGGGFPIYYDDICSLGSVIYMDIPFDDIVARMNKRDFIQRPLFLELDKARELYETRKAIYKERSHFQLDASQNIHAMVHDTVEFLFD